MPSPIIKTLPILFALLISEIAAAAAPVVSVPAVTMPISVDGELTETAWQQALRVEQPNCVYWLARDGGRFAVAVQSRRSDGEKPTARAVPRSGNSPAFIDDHVELTVNGRFAAFNARSAVWQDSPSQTDSPIEPIAWKTKSKIADDGTWTFEAAASCADLGIVVPNDPAAPCSVPVAVVRRWFEGTQQGDEFKIAFEFAYYPSINTVKAKADIAALPARDQVTGADILLLKKDAEKKTELARTDVGPIQNGQARLDRWLVPDLAEGEYELELVLQGVKHSRIAKSFVRHKFDWENNQIGMSDRLIPPFTPIQIVIGETPDNTNAAVVETLLRRHTIDGLGLWSQVEITDSKGNRKRLLAAPSRLEIAVDGRPAEAIAGSGIRWTKQTPTRAEGEADWFVSAGQPDNPVRGCVSVLWDFDGLAQWNLTLKPTNRRIDSLRLIVPMVNQFAPLMHTCTDGIRFNYAGAVPSGDRTSASGTSASGTVWKSSDAPRRQIVGNFVPYLWVGAEEPGISICAENDCGWINNPDTPCQELVRADNTLNIVYNLISRPSTIRDSRTINLGFQATPIKPMPNGWRRKTFGAWQTASYVPPEDYLNFWGACYYWGAESPCRDYYPRGRDMTYLKKIAQFRNGGEKDTEFMRHWMDGYSDALAAITDPDQRAAMDKTYRAHVNAGFNVRQHAPICAYTNGRGVRFDTPEGQTFVNEWNVAPFSSRFWPYAGGVDYDLDPVPSFRDYALWYFKQMAEIAVDTIYWDDFFFVSNFNTFLTAAYPITDPETGTPDGRIQPSMGLYNMREYVRRTAVMYLEMGRQPNNIIHDTNAAINPILSMAQMNYTWEDKPGDADFQDRFSRDYIRAESIGRQQGNIPYNLWLVHGNDEKKRNWASHTGTGVALTHEMRSGGEDYWSVYRQLYDFGYGTATVEVANYWDDDYPVRVSGIDSSSILLKKSAAGKLEAERILVLCDWSESADPKLPDRAVDVSIDGFHPKTAVNLQTGQELEIAPDGQVRFRLKRHDYIVLKLTGSLSPGD